MPFDTAYEAISEDTDTSHRWAFGTGFTDPLAGVDTVVPAGVDGADLAAYCLMLGDDALIMSHRLQQWLARAPELEEDTALANIALDLLGQARLLLTRAGAADGSDRTEDDYAFGRGEREFRNVRLAEVTDADFAGLMTALADPARLQHMAPGTADKAAVLRRPGTGGGRGTRRERADVSPRLRG